MTLHNPLRLIIRLGLFGIQGISADAPKPTFIVSAQSRLIDLRIDTPKTSQRVDVRSISLQHQGQAPQVWDFSRPKP